MSNLQVKNIITTLLTIKGFNNIISVNDFLPSFMYNFNIVVDDHMIAKLQNTLNEIDWLNNGNYNRTLHICCHKEWRDPNNDKVYIQCSITSPGLLNQIVNSTVF